MAADRELTSALHALSRALAATGAPAMIIGGLAMIARGVPRQTIDIDATIWADGLSIDSLLQRLAAEQIAPRTDDARTFAEAHQVLLLRHMPTATLIEITLAWLPFEQQALARASVVRLGDADVRVGQPQDLVVYKAVAWRDRDRGDINACSARIQTPT